MNYNEQIVSAIDIGTTKIVAIVGKKDEAGKIEILGMGKSPSKGVKRGVVLNIEDTITAIQSAVNQAEEMAGIKMKDVFVGIAGQHIKSIQNRRYIDTFSYDDEITQADVDRLIEDMFRIPTEPGEEILHVIPQSYIVDKEVGVKNPVGISGKRLEGNFHIVLGQIASANNIKKCVNRVNLNVFELILEPLASSDAVLSEEEKELGVALVDIGGGTTDIAVFYEGIIHHTAVIPFGGNVVTTDIKEGCGILENIAEKLKVNYGSALADYEQENKYITIPGLKGRDPKEISFVNLANIIQARMEEIIDAIFFEIESSNIADKLGGGIVITGGGAMLKYLPQLIAFKTGMDVRIGYPNEYLSSEVISEINQPMYATSVGLVLRGLEELSKGKKHDYKSPDAKNPEIEKPKEVEPKKVKKGFGLFERFKQISDTMFEKDEDVKME
ncbi:MAG: cell division protein FtsA [Bacteroidales bacterium]|nr:cell division protein FtsA [Bacteroidales bacterium]